MTATLHPATPMLRHRFHLLDALRGIGALFVVCRHMPSFVFPYNGDSMFLAVDYFFCLSGFVLAFSYRQRLQSSLTLRDFLAARIIRLYPTFLLGILFGIAEALIVDPSIHRNAAHAVRFLVLVPLQMLMLPSMGIWLLKLAFPLDFPAWSLFFEMLVSLGFALIVRRWRLPRTILLSLLLVLSLLWIMHGLRGGNLNVGIGSDPKTLLQAAVRTTISFALGVAVFHLFRRTKPWSTATLLHTGAAAAIALCLVLILASPFAVLRTTGFHLATIFLLYPAIIFTSAHVHVPSFFTRPLSFLGDISYPLYLLHAPILIPVMLAPAFAHFAQHHAHATPILFATVFIIALTLCALVVRFYEKPVRRRLTQRYNAFRPTQQLSNINPTPGTPPVIQSTP